MGLETVVLSYAGNYPGIPLADIYLEIDTTNTVQVLEAARRYNISGIVTAGTDVSVPTIGVVVDSLGLRGTDGMDGSERFLENFVSYSAA